MSEKLKIGISIGDVNGIGLEVIIKTLGDNKIYDYCTPIVYGQTKIASFHRRTTGINELNFHVINHPGLAQQRKANMINCWEEDVKIDLGVINEIGGKYAFLSLQRATNDLVNGDIDALVTAPINKDNIQNEEFKFPGHTEYLQERAGASDVLMFLVSESLRVGVVTGHIPLKTVAGNITTEKILAKLKLMDASLRQDFWIRRPKIAVLGLNPHAGDNGLIGNEEQEIIIPAINEAKANDILAFGPYPADGFFANDSYRKFDAVLAMYHDQGLIPFKQLAFESGVNFTAGLNFVRTSPDHGTAYDIAGKNEASATSFREALFTAIHIVKNRRENAILTENPLTFTKLSRDRD
ncbi:MAG: 4-hydroxythreonine-4-phosphate dehydrogenase PdxA [Bacteroidetes bacterium]|nr:4-hydroxythreonine-4-phosphate dehydrogenase PdxA [Bacteroidota bacterium]